MHESYCMRGVNSSCSAPSHGEQPEGHKSNEEDRHLKDDGKTVDKRESVKVGATGLCQDRLMGQ
jgi:hypothetical protein